MDKGDKNIEQFFNKSLEQFKDAPSDRVWENLSHQLGDAPPTFFQRFKNWMLAGTLLALIAFSIWGYFTLSHKIQLLTDQTIVQAINNASLQKQLSTCQNTTTSIQQTLQEVKEQPLRNTTPISNTSKTEAPVNKVRNTSFVFSSPAFVNVSFGEDSPTVFSGSFTSMKTSSIPFGDSYFFHRTAPQSKQTNPFSTDQKKEEVSFPLSEEAKEELVLSRGKPYATPLFTVLDKPRKAIKGFRKRGLPSDFNWTFSPPIRTIKKFRPAYRFGIDATAYMVFTDQQDNFSLSQRFGVTNELQIYNNVFLTAGIGYRFQDYDIDITTNNQHILPLYPLSPESGNPSFEIHQEVKILDVPLGLKWYSDWKENGNRYFVHPSMTWQFYFPQKFEYTEEDNKPISLAFSNQYFGYLGTAQLQVGLERNLGKKWNMQWGLWGEKSLIPMGLGDRSLFNFGVRGAVYLR